MSTLKYDLKAGAVERIFCNVCRQNTNHTLIGFHRAPIEWVVYGTSIPVDEDDDGERYEGDETCCTEFRLWACCGCDAGTMEAMNGFCEPYPPSTTFYPPRERLEVSYKEFRRLSPKLAAIYREVITSFNYDLSILCAVGLRALLEGICKDKGLSGNNLYQKIDGLKDHLPDHIVEALHHYRLIGNEAVHDLADVDQQTLKALVQVIEDILNYLYELDYKTAQLGRLRERNGTDSET